MSHRSAATKRRRDSQNLRGIRTELRRMLELQENLPGIRTELRRILALQEQVRRVERRVDSVQRRLALAELPLEPPYDLTAHRYRVFSQNDEDGITLELVRRIGPGPGRFVDIGSGVKGGNSRILAEELGFRGLLLDARKEVERLGSLFPPGQVTALATWITRDNLDQLIREHGLEGEIDVLSIDVDGVDYWLWDGLSAASPRIVVCEYNSLFGPEIAVTVPYDEEFNRKELHVRYFGVSLAGLVALGRRKGYKLVCVEPAGVNAYFVRNDLWRDHPGFEAREVFRKHRSHAAQARKSGFDVAGFTPESGFPLIDVSEAPADPPRYWRPGSARS